MASLAYVGTEVVLPVETLSAAAARLREQMNVLNVFLGVRACRQHLEADRTYKLYISVHGRLLDSGPIEFLK